MINLSIEEVKRRIREIEEGTAGTVRIGVSSACSNMLTNYIATFRENYPQIKLNILIGDSEGLLEKLKQKEIDIALLLRPSHTEHYDMKIMKKEHAVLIVPNSWSISLSDQPTLKEIAPLPFIMLGAMEGYFFHRNILKAFEEHEVKPNIIIECKDIPMVVSLVNRGIGISIIPRMHYKSLFFKHLKVYEFSQFDFSVEPVMMKLKDASTSKAATQFWGMVT